MRFIILSIAIAFGLQACIPAKKNTSINTLPATEMQPVGRSYINEANQLALVSSAAHFSFSFEGEACELKVLLPAGAGHNYLQYAVNGVYQERVKIEGGGPQVIPIKGAAKGKTQVAVYKATEAHTGDIFIEEISGKAVRALAAASGPVIEFIGNSITCGAAADPSEVPCGTGTYHDQHNAYMAYGPRVARVLGVEYILNSVSGIGIYRNWNSDGPTMPQVYDKIDFQEGTTKLWNHKSYQPIIISIALGTNDFSNGDGKRERRRFDSAQFVSNYIRFVQQVKQKNKNAQLALLSSPMVHGSNAVLLQNCLSTVKREIERLQPGDKSVALYFFKPMQARGCTGHPSVEDHAILAEELLPFFRQLLQ